jgi:hypothetical protein
MNLPRQWNSGFSGLCESLCTEVSRKQRTRTLGDALETVRGIMPDVDLGALKRLASLVVDDAVKVGVRRAGLVLANDGRAVGLAGHAAAVEGAEDSRVGALGLGLFGAKVGERVDKGLDALGAWRQGSRLRPVRRGTDEDIGDEDHLIALVRGDLAGLVEQGAGTEPLLPDN